VPIDPSAKRLLERLAAARVAGSAARSLAERRANLVELLALSGPPQPVAHISQQIIPGAATPLAVRVYTPDSAGPAPLPALLYLHGGGLVAGSIDSHDNLARALANAGACRVLSLDYRLAPENPFPAALDDAVTAVRHLYVHADRYGLDRDRLGLAGDSAGATLAAAATLALARAGGPRLRLQLLICPILDYAHRSESRRRLATGHLLEQATLDDDLRWYLPPGVAADDPRISPLCATELSGVPAAVVHAAEYDPLHDEIEAYVQRLRRAGVPVLYRCHAGMIHLFYAMGRVIPYAQFALMQIGADVQTALS